MKLENIIKLKLNNFEIAPNAEALPKEDKATIGKVDLADYPWSQCIADQIERYGDEEVAKRVCGAIKALYAERQEMIEPNPCENGYEAIGLKEKDGKMVPNCVPIKEEQSKQDFVIPSPNADESESDYISRCNSAIYDEFPDDAQRNAVCYAQWEKK
jgi:hypothetical protein